MEHPLLGLLDGRRGHFRMESGYHSDAWFQLDRLFDDAAALQPHVAALARAVARHRPDAICGPKVGGAHLARDMGAILGLPWFAADRFEARGAADSALFAVEYRIPVEQRARLKDRRVAVVDDAISAGSAIRGTIADVMAAGGGPVVVGALIVFGDAIDAHLAAIGLPLECGTRTSFGMWPPDHCPLCRRGLPLERVSDA